MKKCLLVIPVHNDSASLPALITQIKNLTTSTNDVAISHLFVNDGSHDDTGRILAAEGMNYVTHLANLGIGAAVQCGYKYAAENDFDYVIQIDGDGQHPPAEIDVLLSAAETYNEDLIIGSRFVVDTGYRPTFARKMGMFYSSWLLRITTGAIIDDTTSGFRLTKKRLIQRFAKEYPQREAGLISLFIAAKAGFRFKEVPITILQREHGKSSINFLRAFIYPSKTIINSIASVLRKPL